MSESPGSRVRNGGGEPPRPPLRVFTEEALALLRRREEPPTAAEAELAGPWEVRRLPGGDWGVFRRADLAAGRPPLVRLKAHWLALLAAAALPALGREAPFRVHPEADEEGYPLLRAGAEVGSVAFFLAELATALDLLEPILRSPAALALLFEAAGATALESAGSELGLRLVSLGDEGEAGE